MTKRSNRVAIAIIGATAFTLAGCRDEQVDAQAFPDLASCTNQATQGGMFSAQDCETAISDANALHVEAAPRYDSQAVCEEQHGVGACGSEAEASQGGSGSIFMPLMAGYLIGNMLGGGRQGMSASQPLYKTSDGKFTNAARSSTFSANRGSTKMSTSQFTRPATTAGKAPMSRATASSRGGFGKSAGRGSFGG